MVKHTQIIRRLLSDELSECVWPFCGGRLKDSLVSRKKSNAILRKKDKILLYKI